MKEEARLRRGGIDQRRSSGGEGQLARCRSVHELHLRRSSKAKELIGEQSGASDWLLIDSPISCVCGKSDIMFL